MLFLTISKTIWKIQKKKILLYIMYIKFSYFQFKYLNIVNKYLSTNKKKYI